MRQKKSKNFGPFVLLLFFIALVIKILVSHQASREGAPLKEKALKPAKGYIAIILDDWGYNNNGLTFLQELNHPVAISVLPQLNYSQLVANYAYGHGQEVMLHLPLEPHKFTEKYPDNYVIRSSMDDETALLILKKSFESVPHAVGVNNHMGSKATEDTALMKLIFTHLKKKHLFFVDSLVSENTICSSLAQKMQVPFAKRSIFLDNKADRQYIEGQFAQLASIAEKKKCVIGIGHDRPLTRQIVLEQTQILTDKGFEIIRVKQLIDNCDLNK